MADGFVAMLLSNLCMATGLAVLAWATQRTFRHPGIAHVLWLLVLLKLITPPLVELPWLPADPQAETMGATAAVAALADTTEESVVGRTMPAPTQTLLVARAPASVPTYPTQTPMDWSAAIQWSLFGVWGLGSLLSLYVVPAAYRLLASRHPPETRVEETSAEGTRTATDAPSSSGAGVLAGPAAPRRD